MGPHKISYTQTKTTCPPFFCIPLLSLSLSRSLPFIFLFLYVIFRRTFFQIIWNYCIEFDRLNDLNTTHFLAFNTIYFTVLVNAHRFCIFRNILDFWNNNKFFFKKNRSICSHNRWYLGVAKSNVVHCYSAYTTRLCYKYKIFVKKTIQQELHIFTLGASNYYWVLRERERKNHYKLTFSVQVFFFFMIHVWLKTARKQVKNEKATTDSECEKEKKG